ncbi:restriction endonuclease subunit S [Shewanella baltica]|uniref:restriction endonuclease subunit S n=1 Tax=Shewanella baltica TaxID=62322 RepID=UPI00217DEBC0|nr:restriction endonuclease subunit S [Shewanella baltica]MCS6128721.1 restriction endonuclease subunit S [Shewanella baltica]MCS6140724.1 restriction endonuclease subunit S [Shewanella baltica]MCS6146935.1 restriction endonuclease subunit S [Shewanella baltica]MCS6171465.1 restriction endonuclease subunit S [Shewanella baltica]MCS6188761.1 restriction endonuclease subunit S [Shewanella baltica]
MSMEKNVPEIRFNGFSGEWEEKALGSDVADIIGGGTPSTSISEFWGGDIDWYSPTEIGDNVYAEGSQKKITALGLKSSSAKILPAGNTILFTSRAGIGDMAILARPGATNQGFQSFVVKEGYSPYFLYSAGNQIKDFALNHASGSTFLEISGKQLGRMKILIPCEKEQTAIGNTFQILDNLINQHQQKHDKLSNIKKAMLEKMFPKQGETIPEIRFKGFSGEWEEVSLSDFGVATSGTSIESEFTKDGKYKVISIGSYSENSVYTEQGIRASLSPKTESRVLNKNDLTMILNDKTLAGNIIGRVLLVEEDDSYVYNQRTQRIEPSSEYNPQFLYQFLNAPSVRKRIFKASQGNTQIYVNWSAISKLKYFIPKKDEQIVIGNYFQKLDVLIKHHQQQITKLNNIKQACLSKMFV